MWDYLSADAAALFLIVSCLGIVAAVGWLWR
jgi:hypothetical protein